jgi:galactokinase
MGDRQEREKVKERTQATERVQLMTSRFRELYGREPEGWVRAPGRAELLGTDTDDNQGYVLTMSIHLDTWIAFAPSEATRSGTDRSTRSRVRVHSLNVDEGTEFVVGREPGEPASSWDRYVNGVSKILGEKGHRPVGADAVVHSTVPIGGGLSSSASLEVAAALMFQAAGSFTLDPKETALVCQQAENRCAGVMCGILDQYSSVFGKRGAAMLLDCRSLSHIEVKIPSDIKVVICDTNVPRTLAGSEYGKRRAECEEGTETLRGLNPEILTLRDVNTPMFERLKDALPETIGRRCRFIVEENQRVMDFTAAVVRDDRESMKKLCAASFAGLRDLYEKSVPQMERMFEAMSEAPGAIAARQSGGGFGGCMIAYVEASKVGGFSDHVRRAYEDKTGIAPTIYVSVPSEGAGPLNV